MKRLQVAVLIYGAATCALLWPLFGRFGSAFPHDAGDPILNTWILWHGSRSFPLTTPWWNGPMFFPMPDSLALSELLLALLPISLPVQALTGNPVAAYNAAFVASFVCSGVAAYLLAREITARQDAAIVAGLAAMFTTYRAEQLSHIQVLSYYWTPIALLGLHRYSADRRWRWLALFAGAWLAQSLANGYAMFHVSVLVALWTVWFIRPLRSAVPVVAAWAVAAALLVPLLLKYSDVHSTLHLTRDINEIKRFGVDLADFFRAAPALALWGNRLGVARPETAVFPGVTLCLLAGTALFAEWRGGTRSSERSAWQRMFVMLASLFALIAFSVFVVGPWAVGPVTVRDFHKPFSVAVGARLAAFLGGPWVRRLWNERSVAGFYILAMAAMYLLALGPEPRVLGRPLLYEPPYAWLMRLPGLDVLRVPARFVMLAAICQSVLVAVALTRWSTPERRRWLAPLVGVALVIEGWVWMPLADVPRRGARPWTGASAVVELPLGDQSADFGALFRAMNHGLPVVNGVSGYVPPHYLPLAHALRDRQFGALFEVATNGRLGVVVDRARPDAMEIAQALRETGFEPASSDEHWDTYVVPPRPPASQATGEKVPIAHVNASSHGEDVARMLDDDVETAWGSATSQVGGETITVDLGVRRDVGAVVLDMGAFSFGHPTVLEVAVSDDALSWQVVWAGSTSVLTVRAAVQRPDVVPMTVYVGRASGRYLRLTQTGAEPGIPWWVANLHVHASVTR